MESQPVYARYIFTVDNGEVQVYVPKAMSAEDAAFAIEFIDLVQRKMRRSVKPPTQVDDAPLVPASA